MPIIKLETLIDAPIERCFDLSRDIDIHLRSTEQTGEIAVGGVTTGLIELGEEVTWEATHLGIRQRLTAKITAFNRPVYFRDSQVRGAFRRFDHHHYFEAIGENRTLMRDKFDYESPLGLLGKFADHLFLTRYLGSFLEKRNLIIKREAEAVR